MLKRLIAYQRLLLNSTPPINMISPSSLKASLYFVAICMMVFMNFFIFMGTELHLNTTLVIILPAVSLWMINRILYGDHRLFDTVPVSRKYTLLNVFLLSIVISVIGYLMFFIAFAVLLCALFGFIYLTSPQDITSTPPEVVLNIIDKTKGNLLILCLFIIIIFSGVAITFIKNKKVRYLSFAGFSITGYSLLYLLKIILPISPTTGDVEFLESFSIMPQSNTILIFVAIGTIIISITSVFMGYKIYVGKPIPSFHKEN